MQHEIFYINLLIKPSYSILAVMLNLALIFIFHIETSNTKYIYNNIKKCINSEFVF